ncbi:hypothetical protein [Halomonas sp.]|uniref:hypothetical protein n=1 Tax=Halomonas sp. TaxID=1486246 RepID=UPI00356855B5
MPFNHARRFQRLTAMLAEWQSVWRPLPFQHPMPPWSACFPGRVEQLRALCDADVDRLQGEPLRDPCARTEMASDRGLRVAGSGCSGKTAGGVVCREGASRAYGRLPGSFEGFCRWAAEHKGLELPDDIDWPALEQLGWHRQAQVSRLDLVRQLFRRPLEIWLMLDRVLYLEEAGFDVELGTFCERRLTPRNLLLRARR